jgi:hypothetical protein
MFLTAKLAKTVSKERKVFIDCQNFAPDFAFFAVRYIHFGTLHSILMRIYMNTELLNIINNRIRGRLQSPPPLIMLFMMFNYKVILNTHAYSFLRLLYSESGTVIINLV